MGFSLRNKHNKTQVLLSSRNSTNVPAVFIEMTEAMAERLADQVPELLRRIDGLQKSKSASQYHKIELQRWIDNKNNELLNLKEMIIARKRSHFKALSNDEQALLAERHPVWMNDFNLHLDQIQDLIAIHKDESIIIQCLLETDILKSLKIFYYASDNNVLTINSNKKLKSLNHQVQMQRDDDVTHQNLTYRPATGEYIFQPMPGRHAQWTFKGNKWGIDDQIMWLDFGKNKVKEEPAIPNIVS